MFMRPRNVQGMFRTWLTMPVLMLSAIVLHAQVPEKANNMMFFGIVDDLRTGKALQNVCIRVYTDSVPGDSVFTDAAGKYQTFQPLHGLQHLVYSLDGHHRKVVEVDLNGEMETADRSREWNMRIDVSLVTAGAALADDLLDTPIGKAKWAPAMHEFQWDQAYTERYMHRFKRALKVAGTGK